jgi:hypothetical protein
MKKGAPKFEYKTFTLGESLTDMGLFSSKTSYQTKLLNFLSPNSQKLRLNG